MCRLAPLFIVLVLVFSCNNTEKAIQPTIISGNIQNAKADTLILYSDNLVLDNKFRVDIPISKEGNFTDTLPNNFNEGFYLFTDGKNYLRLYLKEGDQPYLTYNAENWVESIKLEGNSITTNEYVLLKQQLDNERRSKRDSLNSLSPEAFKSASLELLDKSKSRLNKLEGIPASFKELELLNLNYEHWGRLSYFAMGRNYEAEKYPDSIAKVSENYVPELTSFDMTNEDLFRFSKTYKGLVYNKLEDDAREQAEKDSLKDKKIILLEAVGAIPSEVIRSEFFFRASVPETYQFNEENDLLYQRLVDAYTARYNAPELKDRLYGKSLESGTESPKFDQFEDINGDLMQLEDLKGKYVYMDLWATWCVPCRVEIPFLRKMEQDYHGQNVAFVSVSLDQEKDKEKWKNVVKDSELSGIQLYAAGKAFESEFAKAYGVKSIPRFILIGPDGEVIDSNAPRPSDRNLRELLDSLLQENS
ncbi:TlpA family protein disulfide reductase [Aegicerativicinus sediminis]